MAAISGLDYSLRSVAFIPVLPNPSYCLSSDWTTWWRELALLSTEIWSVDVRCGYDQLAFTMQFIFSIHYTLDIYHQGQI